MFPMENPECCYLHKAIFAFEKGVRDFIGKKVSEPQDAEDIAQEVFLKISLAHSRNEKVINVKSWIYSVAAKTVADFYRRKYRSKEVASDELPAEYTSGKNDQQYCACDFVLPLIDLLEEKYRIPLLLSDINNLNQQEIADKLKLSLPAAKSRIRRARLKLRELFAECTNIEYDIYGNVFTFGIKESCTPMRLARNRLRDS